MSKIRTRRQTVGRPQLEKGPQDKQIRDVGNKVFLMLSFFTNHLLCPFLCFERFLYKLFRRFFELFPDGDAAGF